MKQFYGSIFFLLCLCTITLSSNAESELIGDITHDSKLDLADAIAALQLMGRLNDFIVEKGDGSEWGQTTIKNLSGKTLQLIFNKNGSFSLKNDNAIVLESVGDKERNAGLIWRYAKISTQLPLASSIQGGYMGHEIFSVQDEVQAPWIYGISVSQPQVLTSGVFYDITSVQGETSTILIENFDIQNILSNVIKVTIKTPLKNNHIRISFKSPSDERFYGFGSSSWATQHRGNKIPIWVSESFEGTVTPENPQNEMGLKGKPYENQIAIPFFMSSKGYGFFLDTNRRAEFEMCTENHPDSWQLETWDNETVFFIFTNTSFLSLIETFTALTGRATMPPDWFFAPINDAFGGQANVLRVASFLRKYNIPTSAIWTDDWIGFSQDENKLNLSYDWDVSSEQYPDIQGMIETLHETGYKFLGYFTPFVPNPLATPGHNQEKWSEASINHYLIKNFKGNTQEMLVPPFVNPAGGVLDLTNPKAVTWYKNYVKNAAELGLDGAMLDFGQWVPFDSKFDDSMKTGENTHNEYAMLWQKANREIWDDLVKQKIKKDYLFFSRAGFTGSQKYSQAFWAGCQSTSWNRLNGLASAITIGLNLGMSGIGFYGHDIGGYSSFDTPQITDFPKDVISSVPKSLQSEIWDGVNDKELFLRWTAMGAYSPMMRTNHGLRYGQNWSFEGGPNLENFTITQNTISSLTPVLSLAKELISKDAVVHLELVEKNLNTLVSNSFGTWVDIEKRLRLIAGDTAIDVLNSENLNVAKLILRYAQVNHQKLFYPNPDPETVTIWKKFACQHMALFPYLKAYAKEYVEKGLPILRHMILLYPDDPIIRKGIPSNFVFRPFSGEESKIRPYNEMFQYFLGNEILVAPIIEKGKKERPVYLPSGLWYDVNAGLFLAGRSTVLGKATLDKIPLYIKIGSVIPKLPETVETLLDSKDSSIVDINDEKGKLIVEVYCGKSGFFKMSDGTEFEYIHDASLKPFNVTVNGVYQVPKHENYIFQVRTDSVREAMIIVYSNEDTILYEFTIKKSPVDRIFIVKFIY